MQYITVPFIALVLYGLREFTSYLAVRAATADEQAAKRSEEETPLAV